MLYQVGPVGRTFRQAQDESDIYSCQIRVVVFAYVDAEQLVYIPTFHRRRGFGEQVAGMTTCYNYFLETAVV